MFMLTIAERSVGPFQEKAALVSVLVILFAAIVVLIRFLLSQSAARKKHARLAAYFYPYYELVRKSTENLDTLVWLSTMSLSFPIHHPKIQTLLVKEQHCIVRILALLDTMPKEFTGEAGINIDERREYLLETLETIEGLIMCANKN